VVVLRVRNLVPLLGWHWRRWEDWVDRNPNTLLAESIYLL
jgi:hypothetical protein